MPCPRSAKRRPGRSPPAGSHGLRCSPASAPPPAERTWRRHPRGGRGSASPTPPRPRPGAGTPSRQTPGSTPRPLPALVHRRRLSSPGPHPQQADPRLDAAPAGHRRGRRRDPRQLAGAPRRQQGMRRENRTMEPLATAAARACRQQRARGSPPLARTAAWPMTAPRAAAVVRKPQWRGGRPREERLYPASESDRRAPERHVANPPDCSPFGSQMTRRAPALPLALGRPVDAAGGRRGCRPVATCRNRSARVWRLCTRSRWLANIKVCCCYVILCDRQSVSTGYASPVAKIELCL